MIDLHVYVLFDRIVYQRDTDKTEQQMGFPFAFDIKGSIRVELCSYSNKRIIFLALRWFRT